MNEVHHTLTLDEVRARVIADHGALRKQSARVHGSAERALECGSVDELRDALWHFAKLLEAHLLIEEQRLVPLLVSVDPWGPARVENLLEEHERQRAQVRAVLLDAETGGADAATLVAEVLDLLSALLEDMRQEERDLQALREDGFDEAPFSG